jgi:polyferredoxin
MSRIPQPVVEPAGGAAYVSERKIYPRDVSGRLRRLRMAALIVLLGLFYLIPWLRWDGRQAVLFDLPARKFHIFSLTFWPQDFLFLALLLIMAALTLFFFTALAGRLWCGYACPQTVWTEAFLLMERWTEGDRLQRMKLDAAAWSAHKLLRKGSKHLLWIVFALWTGYTFVGFFTPIADLGQRAFNWGGWEIFWVLFYSLATWGNAGFLREQVCKYMCPYARFQSAMFDRNTLIIAYDPMRGEPRGPRKRGALASVLQRARGLLDKLTAYDYVIRASQHPSAASVQTQARGTITFDSRTPAPPLPFFTGEQLGDCVDCTLCVQVCPTGIDIRNGLQYECIACGACVDACDTVMDKLDYPRGLVRYTTQHAIDGKPTHILRPRILVYAAILLALMTAWTWGVSHRSSFIAEILRDRNALYRVNSDGSIVNSYQLKIVNKTDLQREFIVTVAPDDDGLTLQGGQVHVKAGAAVVISVPLTVQAAAAVTARHGLHFVVAPVDGGKPRTVESSFFGPSPRHDAHDDERERE